MSRLQHDPAPRTIAPIPFQIVLTNVTTVRRMRSTLWNPAPTLRPKPPQTLHLQCPQQIGPPSQQTPSSLRNVS